MLSILFYGILLVDMLTIEDDDYTKMLQNIAIQIVNGLFTFAAVLNLPVRLRRLRDLWMQRQSGNPGVMRTITFALFPSARKDFEKQPTEAWEQESEFIFERLAWSTKHIIIQALLWNSLFQIINQVFRCIYYSYELANTTPGEIWVSVFFPLAILASILAALTQAIAENRFREKWELAKKPNNLKKTLVEFWYNIWKDQTEGQVGLANKFDNIAPRLARSPILDLRRRTVAGRGVQEAGQDAPIEEHSISVDEADQYVGPTNEEIEEPVKVERKEVASDNYDTHNLSANPDTEKRYVVKDEVENLEIKVNKRTTAESLSSEELKKNTRNSLSVEEVTTINVASKSVELARTYLTGRRSSL